MEHADLQLGISFPEAHQIGYEKDFMKVLEYDFTQPENDFDTRSKKLDNTFSNQDNSLDSCRQFNKTTIVNGADIVDFPAEYTVCGLGFGELPVIGVYVHQQITPGFKYRIRILSGERDRYLFEGQSLYLSSVGRGYGKRITFEGDSSNYFYSDTNSQGYGFRVTALESDEKFTVLDTDGRVAGEGEVEKVFYQKEITTDIEAGEHITKYIAVRFACKVKFNEARHGLLPLCSEEVHNVTGLAHVVKHKGNMRAVTKVVRNIIFPKHGSCVLSMSG